MDPTEPGSQFRLGRFLAQGLLLVVALASFALFATALAVLFRPRHDAGSATATTVAVPSWVRELDATPTALIES